MDEIDRFLPLATALGVGLLIGLERGWQAREVAEGGRVAGVRTFGLIGLLGGLTGQLGAAPGSILVPAGLAALALVLAVGHLGRGAPGSAGITGLVAALVTYCLGAFAVTGHPGLAAAAAVVVAVLLEVKPGLHRMVAALSEAEIAALLRFLVISLVILPVLPDAGFGPYGALNPYRVWWMVVLIAGLSFAGYWAVRLAGPERGYPLTGLLGGLVSSTAVTATLARAGRARPGDVEAISAGILLASTVMAVRVLAIAAIISPAMALRIVTPIGLMALAGLAAGAWCWARRARDPTKAASAASAIANPLDLAVALRFGALLAFILVAARLIKVHVGDWGLYALGAVSGLADVDAITLSMSSRASEAPLAPLAGAVLVAVASNTLVKAAIATGLGGAALARRTGAGFALMLMAAAGGFALAPL
jgi:uncharacterized membrane protein (DUF4010 family)